MNAGESYFTSTMQASELSRSMGVNAAQTDGFATDRVARAKRVDAATEVVLPVLQLTMGVLVATSAIVGYVLDPGISAIAALMGVGLIIAGVAGLVRTGRRARAASQLLRSNL